MVKVNTTIKTEESIISSTVQEDVRVDAVVTCSNANVIDSSDTPDVIDVRFSCFCCCFAWASTTGDEKNHVKYRDRSGGSEEKEINDR